MALGKFLTLLALYLSVILAQRLEMVEAESNDFSPEVEEPKPVEKKQQPMFCKEELPSLSVYDVMIDASNWDLFKKKHDLFILGVTDSQCATCCQTEPLLKELQDMFQAGQYTYKGKKIPIARIDTSAKHTFMQKDDLHFESVPKIVIVKSQRYFGFDFPVNRTDLLLHQINVILNPIVELTTEEEVENFLETQDTFWQGDYETNFFKKSKAVVPRMEEHYSELRFKTRVICFLYDKQEYKDEYKNLKNDARFLAARDNLRVGFVDNQRVIKKIKAKYATKMFSSVSLSSLVLKRYDGELKYYDLTSEDHVFIHYWINKNSVKEVEELTTESYRIQEQLRQPMFLTFVDFDNQQVAKECYRAVEVMKEVAPKYSHIMGFYYVNNTLFWQRKRILGVTWDELPSMAFNMIDQRVMPYPRGKEISKVVMFDWFDALLKGKIQSETIDFSKIKNDTEIETYLLNNTIPATRSTFSEIVLEEGYDVVLFIYTTEVINNVQRNIALQFNLVADAFEKLRMTHTIKAVSYDINVNAFPEGIEFTLDLPQIYFFPAYNKRTPYKKYIGQGIAGQILLYCQKLADIQFKYPVDVSKVGLPKDEEQKPVVDENQEQPEEVTSNFNDFDLQIEEPTIQEVVNTGHQEEEL